MLAERYYKKQRRGFVAYLELLNTMADSIKGNVLLCIILGDKHGFLFFIHQDDKVVLKSDFFHKKTFEERKRRNSELTPEQLPESAEVWLNPIYRAAIEATEEAIINAIFKAETMVGRDGNTRYGIPLDRILKIMEKYGRL